jgi:Glyoxalase/Bleomycin resistance protein/Dioxygenase superfamily
VLAELQGHDTWQFYQLFLKCHADSDMKGAPVTVVSTPQARECSGVDITSHAFWSRPYTVPVVTADGPMDIPFKLVYSLEAPHIELVQEVPGSIWVSAPRNAVHHLGYWAEDVAATGARLEPAGYTLEARPGGDAPPVFAYCLDPLGRRPDEFDEQRDHNPRFDGLPRRGLRGHRGHRGRLANVRPDRESHHPVR